MSTVPFFKDSDGVTTTTCPYCQIRTKFYPVSAKELTDAGSKGGNPVLGFIAKTTCIFIGPIVKSITDTIDGTSSYRCEKCGKHFLISLSGNTISRGNSDIDR